MSKSEILYHEMNEASKALKAFPRGEMGLAPDAVKFSPEFRAAKQTYDAAFQAVRTFNSSPTQRYINAIKNPRKKAYAVAWNAFVTNQGPDPGDERDFLGAVNSGISFMAGQAVRNHLLNLHKQERMASEFEGGNDAEG